MNPGGYLRGTVDLVGPPEIRDRAHTFPRSVFIALLLLGLLQVGCTLGLFFYVKTQVEPNLMNKKELQCWRTILKKGEAPLSMDTIAKKEGNECENVQLAFNEAVEKAVQGLKSQKQLHIGNDINLDPVLSRSNNHQTWPAAHLTIANSTSGDSNAAVHLMYWNHKEGWANTQNMNYNNGTLKVQQDGYYFVYANLCFRHHKVAKKITQDSLQLMLYVLKSNKSGRPAETLLKGGRTATWSNDSLYHFYSVYQGGIFRLLAGEEIFIKASSAELLDPSQEASYFGAFKVLDIHL